jgi:hypothetical protein
MDIVQTIAIAVGLAFVGALMAILVQYAKEKKEK